MWSSRIALGDSTRLLRYTIYLMIFGQIRKKGEKKVYKEKKDEFERFLEREIVLTKKKVLLQVHT